VNESSDSDTYGRSCITDHNNDLYFAYHQYDPITLQISKYSSIGDSLWTISFDSTISMWSIELRTTNEGTIIISGYFSGTLSLSGNSINTVHKGVFILELDSEGNLVNLVKAVELLYALDGYLFDVSNNGSIFMSVNGPGPAFINTDTLGISKTHLLYFDQDYQLKWYNNEFNTNYEGINNLIFISESDILINGIDKIDGISYRFIYEYDEEGNKTNQKFITGGSFGFTNSLIQTAENRIITGGTFYNYVIIDDDTLYGFGDRNCFLYTFSGDLDVVKSSHISGIEKIGGIVEYDNNSYLMGALSPTGWDVIFANDTIPDINNAGIFIAKLNNQNNPVYESRWEDQLTVYPNPSTGIFNIQLPDVYKDKIFATVYGINGQKISTFEFTPKQTSFDLSGYTKGVFFVQVKTGKVKIIIVICNA